MRDNDVEYFRRRINEEIELAGRAADLESARVHRETAERYILMLRSMAAESDTPTFDSAHKG